MAFLSRNVVNFVSCLVLFAAFNVQAADDDYLKMLEAEAEGSHIDDSSQSKKNAAVVSTAAIADRKEWIGECDYISDAMPDDLAREEFASYMKQCSLGTYVFYRRLEPNLKNAVYKTYTAMSPATLTVLKKEILKYF